MGLLKTEPSKYEGVYVGRKVNIVKRGCGFSTTPYAGGQAVRWITAVCDTGLGDASFTDDFCEDVLREHKGRDITGSLKRIGRGEGLYDVPGLKICGNVDPSDVSQGSIGD